MPNSRAIGAVTKLLVAVITTRRSPRWRSTSARAESRMIGRILRCHELAMPRVEHGARMARQRLQLEVEELVDVERAGLVLLVELVVARFVDLAVEHALLDQELRPLEIAVAREQRVVEIEERELHRSRVIR